MILMKLICKITDEDLGESMIEMNEPRMRYGARGIVIRNDGKIFKNLEQIANFLNSQC